MDHCASRLILIISDLYCCKSSTNGSWFKDIDLHPGSKFLPQVKRCRCSSNACSDHSYPFGLLLQPWGRG